MHCLAVRQQDHSEVSAAGFRDLRPTSNSTVSLNLLANGLSQSPLNPPILDGGTVGARADRLEVLSELHDSDSITLNPSKIP